jgi:ABC-type transporter Mla MlaB component
MAIGSNMKRKKLIPEELETQVPLEKATPSSPSSNEKKETVLSVNEKEEQKEVTFIVEPSRRKSVKKATVIIEGKLNINTSAFIAQQIKAVLKDYDILDFKLQNIIEIDMTSIQVLYYYKTVFNRLNKQISLQADGLSLEMKKLLMKTKYNKILFKKPTQ